VVGTPIGNLRDITLRAIEVLGAVDVIAAEDTRTSAPMLANHGIRARLIAAHDHNESTAAARIVELLATGHSVALISDAGTPAVSDPGARIVRAVMEAGHSVTPVPGPSAAISALSVSGCEGPFLFAGFAPPKSAARRTFLRDLASERRNIVLYEAPHRILDMASDLELEFEPDRRIAVMRELTKRFETVHALPVAELRAWLEADTNRQRGEFVLVIDAARERNHDTQEADRVLRLLLDELPVKSAAKIAAAITGQAKNTLYRRALEIKGSDHPDDRVSAQHEDGL
jgi:16S rRNA (cytidine1402-2'-O)-methyltransferase